MKLAKASIPYRALRDIGTLIAVFLFSGELSMQTLEPVFVIFAALGFVAIVSASLAWEYFVWRRYDYFFEEDSLKITHGVFRRKERDIPYRRIQNVNIKKNIVQRVLAIAKVDFETAGGSGTEASLKYVKKEEAKNIQKKVKEFKRGTEEEELEDDEKREKLFELSSRDLIAYSFLSVNVRSIAIALTAFGLFSGLGAGLAEGISFAPVLVFSVIALTVLTGFWIFNAASNYLQYYDFKLWREKDTLEYERGLLNRSEGSIPVEKVQGVSIEENFLKRQIDYATMKIETAGLSNEQQVKSDEVAVPLAKRDTVINFAQRLEPFESLDIESIPPRARRRYIGRYSITLGLLLSGGFLLDSFVTPFNYGLLMAILPVTFIAAHLKWINKGYQLQEDHFISMNGFWSRRTAVTPYYRVQNLIQTETIFQRRWNLSSLTLDTAGNLISRDSKAPDLDVKEASKLRESVFKKFKKSLADRKIR
jgi:putative membrane protein